MNAPHFYFSNKANKEDEKGQVLKADCWITPAQYIENEETDGKKSIKVLQKLHVYFKSTIYDYRYLFKTRRTLLVGNSLKKLLK